jgi:hypothetical protein
MTTKYEAAKAAVDAVFSNTDVPAELVRAELEALQDDIQEKLDTLPEAEL